MTADPRDGVSEITEIDEFDIAPHLWAFARAVFWGAVAGGGVIMLLTVPIGFGLLIDGKIWAGFALALLPLAIAGAGTLIGMLLAGLPLTALLKRDRSESVQTYSTVGAASGLLLPTILAGILDGFGVSAMGSGFFLGLFGMMAGGVAGSIWGNWRTSLRCEAEGKRSPTEPQNPFHDLLH